MFLQVILPNISEFLFKLWFRVSEVATPSSSHSTALIPTAGTGVRCQAVHQDPGWPLPFHEAKFTPESREALEEAKLKAVPSGAALRS